MNYSNNIDQIVFLKDRDIVLSIDGTNLSGAVLSNGIPSYDLLSAQVNILSSRDDFLSNYINDFIEVSCNNLCTVVSNLINRDHKDVSYLGNVKLSTEYLDATGTGLAENTLYGLLLTNKNSNIRKMHSGFLFNAIADDPLSDFTIVDGNRNTAILHENDYILVVNDVESVVDIQLSDVRFIKDYTKIANTLSVYEQNLCAEIQTLSTQLSTDLSSLSCNLICLSSNLCTEIKTLSTWLSIDVDSLSNDMIKRDKAISDYISSYVEVSCSNLCAVVSSLINRDYKDVSFFGDVNLADSYSDPEQEGTTDNTLFGLLLTNGKTRDRKLHPGYLFHAKAEDAIKNFEVKDGNREKLILHDNDYILVVNDVDAVKNVKISDVILIKDYTSDLSTATKNLSTDIESISAEIYSNISATSCDLSTQLCTLSSNLCAQIESLCIELTDTISAVSAELSNYTIKESANLCSEISTLSTTLSIDIIGLSANLCADIKTLSTQLSIETTTLSSTLCIDINFLSIGLSTDLSILSIDLSGLSSNICADINFINTEIKNIKDDVRGGVNYKGHISLSAGRYYTATGTLDLSGVFGAYLNAMTTEGTLSNDIELNNGWLYNVTTTNPYITKDGITFENNDYIIIHNHDLSSAHISELTRSTIDIIEAVQDDYVRLYQLQQLSANLSTDIKTLSGRLCVDVNTVRSNLCVEIQTLSTDLSTSVNSEFVHMSGDVNIGTLQINGNISADKFSTNEKLVHAATYGISSITYIDNSELDSGRSSKKYDIAYPEKTGTIALTSDVSDLSNDLTAEINSVSTTLSLDISSTVAVFDNNGNFIGNKLSATKITNAAYDAAVVAGTLNDQCIYVIDDDHVSMRGQLIRNVCDPQLSSDAATKNYVDNSISQVNSNINDLCAALSTDIKTLSGNLCADIKNLSNDLSNEIQRLSSSLCATVNKEFVHMSGDVGIGALEVNAAVSATEFIVTPNANGYSARLEAKKIVVNDQHLAGRELTAYDLDFQYKSGTIALTSDVVDLSNDLTAEINSVSTLISNDLSSTVAIYSDNGTTYVGNKLSAVKISNAEYENAVKNNNIDNKCVYVIDDTYYSAYGQQIRNVADPTVSSDAATKHYVDEISATISSNIDTKFATKTELNDLALSVDGLSTAVNYVSSDLSTLEYKHYYATLSSIENKTDVHTVEGQYPDNLLIVDHTNEHEGHQKYYLKFKYGTLVLAEIQ